MKLTKNIFVIALILGLSACAAIKPASQSELSLKTAPVSAYNVRGLRVVAPDTLTVSEANSYLPAGDIVWRGDPFGERYLQVATIFFEALKRGTSGLHGAHGINVNIEIVRFHALTNRARYTVGGVHRISFILTLRDAKTGALIEEPRLIRADLKAFGGGRALAAERRGQTQKVRITDHLAAVIQREITGQ